MRTELPLCQIAMTAGFTKPSAETWGSHSLHSNHTFEVSNSHISGFAHFEELLRVLYTISAIHARFTNALSLPMRMPKLFRSLAALPY